MNSFTFVKPDIVIQQADVLYDQLREQDKVEKEKYKQECEKREEGKKGDQKMKIIKFIEDSMKSIDPCSEGYDLGFSQFYNNNTYQNVKKLVSELAALMNAVGFKSKLSEKKSYGVKEFRLVINNPNYYTRVSRVENPSILRKPSPDFSDDFTIQELYDAYDEKKQKADLYFCGLVNNILGNLTIDNISNSQIGKLENRQGKREIQIICYKFEYTEDKFCMTLCAPKVIELLKSQGYPNIQVYEREKMEENCHFRTLVDSFIIKL